MTTMAMINPVSMTALPSLGANTQEASPRAPGPKRQGVNDA